MLRDSIIMSSIIYGGQIMASKLMRIKDYLENKVIARKAMFLPLVCVSTFMLVGYAAVDKEAPVIETNTVELVYQGSLTLDMINVSDNRDEPATLNVSIDENNLNINQLGSYTINVTAKDSFNNEAQKEVTVNVVDLTAPTIEPLGQIQGYVINVPVKGSNDLGNYLLASDDVDGDVTPFIESSAKLDTAKLGLQTLELTVADSSANVTKTTYTFNVTDTQAPKIDLPKGANVVLEYNQNFNLNDYFKATDNFESNLKVETAGAVDVKKYQEKQTVEIVVTDSSENQTRQTMTFVVEDNQAPSLKLKNSSITVSANDSLNLASYVSSATDNKDGNVVKEVSFNTISTSSAGTKIVTYQVADEAGNKATAQLKVRVVAPVTYSSVTGNRIVDVAFSKIGTPYVYGATGPNAFDCSGFTQWVYRQNGKTIPRTSTAQKTGGTVISISQARPGDILWRSGHVAIYVGGNSYIHAPHTGAYVRVDSGIYSFTCAVRY